MADTPSVSFAGFPAYFSGNQAGSLLAAGLILAAGSCETYLIRRLNAATHTLETNRLIYIGAVITLPIMVALPLDEQIARLDFYTVGSVMILAAVAFANLGRNQTRFALH